MNGRTPPQYFEAVRQEAARRWDQLERDPGLAAPWHQLFMQVRSPRHVLSELLQNADDASATWARAAVDERGLVFEHNGSDFTEDQFRSICQFGYSNKRHLHTIGFRGLGFKSCFGCGSRVELVTPSLAVSFSEDRFTEPVWNHDASHGQHTLVRVPDVASQVREALRQEFDRWKASPIPLLFFQSITEVELEGTKLSRVIEGPGPAKGSTQVILKGLATVKVLVVRSPREVPPLEVIEEVRRERGDPAINLPPMGVDLVLGGGPSGIYVVLPTSVKLGCAFSIQGPFLQDPARIGIKDPATSATNRWLLDRAGRLGAQVLADWLSNRSLTTSEQAEGYALLPPVGTTAEPGVLGSITEQVNSSMRAALKNRKVILTSSGSLDDGSQVYDLPEPISGVWGDLEVLRVLGRGESSVVSPSITSQHRARLSAWSLLRRTTPDDLLSALLRTPGEKPQSGKLIQLWSYVYKLIKANLYADHWRDLYIVPVNGNQRLGRARDSIPLRLPEGDVSEDELDTLARYSSIVDPTWLELVTGPASVTDDSVGQEARDLLRVIDLDRSASMTEVLNAAADLGFKRGFARVDAVRLASVAAKTETPVSDGFVYFTEDSKPHRAKEGVLASAFVPSSTRVPRDWVAAHVLHPDYYQGDPFLESARWRAWLRSNDSALWASPPPLPTTRRSNGQREVKRLVEARGGTLQDPLRLRSGTLIVTDFDFDDPLVNAWTDAADPTTWVDVVSALGKIWSTTWAARSLLKVQESGNKYIYPVSTGGAVAKWVDRLRSLPCVPNESGTPSVPSTLLRRTASTSFLEGIESFVDASFEERCSPDLLDLLGVRSEGGRVESILERLRSQSLNTSPSLPLVCDLCRALDRLYGRLSQGDAEDLSRVFAKERLIRTQDGSWETSAGVFRSNPEGIPGAATIWDEIKSLGLWSKAGVASAPSTAFLLDWIKSLPIGERLPEPERLRLRQVLAHQGEIVWGDLRCWASVSGHLVRENDLEWFTTTRSAADGMFEYLRHRIADASMLPSSINPKEMFTGKGAVEQVLVLDPTAYGERKEERPSWVTTLGQSIARLDTENGAWVTIEDKTIGLELSATNWISCLSLSVTPELDDRIAGSARSVSAAWSNTDLLVSGTPAQHHTDLIQEIQRRFRSDHIRKAIEHCVARSPEWIEEYFSSRWVLLDEADLAQPLADAGTLPPLATPEPASEVVAPATPRVTDGMRPTSGEDRDARRHRSGPAWFDTLGRFFESSGFTWEGELFRHAAGDVVRVKEDLMHATRYNGQGAVTRRYWACDAPLEVGVEIPAEVWIAIRKDSAGHSLLVRRGGGTIAEFNCADLIGRVDEFPSQYRIRLPSD